MTEKTEWCLLIPLKMWNQRKHIPIFYLIVVYQTLSARVNDITISNPCFLFGLSCIFTSISNDAGIIRQC